MMTKRIIFEILGPVCKCLSTFYCNLFSLSNPTFHNLIEFGEHLQLKLELELEWFIFHRKQGHLHLRKIINHLSRCEVHLSIIQKCSLYFQFECR